MESKELKPTGLTLFGMEIYIDKDLTADEWYLQSKHPSGGLVSFDRQEVIKILHKHGFSGDNLVKAVWEIEERFGQIEIKYPPRKELESLKYFVSKQQNLPPEITKIVDDNFWGLLDDIKKLNPDTKEN